MGECVQDTFRRPLDTEAIFGATGGPCDPKQLNKDSMLAQKACPPGTTLDPKKASCEFAQQKSQQLCLPGVFGPVCSPSWAWYVPGGCIPEEQGDISYGFACCAGLVDNPEKYCPLHFCLESDTCGVYMTKHCPGIMKTDFANPPTDTSYKLCSTYLRDTSLDSAREAIYSEIAKNFFNEPINDDMVVFCKSAPPGTCDVLLKSKCSTYSRKDLEKDERLQTLCGCFMPDYVYNKYDDLTGGDSKCDPLCTNAYSIQRGRQGEYDKCDRATCIIDFNDQNVKERFEKNLDLSQNCDGDNSVCYIGLTYNDIQNLKNNIKVDQKCGSCWLWNPDEPRTQPTRLDCDNILGSLPTPQPSPQPSSNKLNIPLIAGITIGVLVLFVIFFFYYEIING